MRYKRTQTDIFSVFGSDAWKAENIQTVPKDFTPKGLASEYIRVSILSGNSTRFSGTGMVIIDIFTPAGKGPDRIVTIADRLEHHFANKILSTSEGNSIQFFTSSLGKSEFDKDNPALTRVTYTLTFKLYGVT